MRKVSTIVSCVILMFLGWSCAQDIDDIKRVQSNALKKELFRMKDNNGKLRVWYYQRTVIDVPLGSSATFVGEQSKTEKIVWEISERFLNAYRVNEHIKNTDKSHQRVGTGEYKSSLIASYPIIAHFDQQRQFNPATGEQTNVIVEDYSSRPWDQRDYFRVDFANNLVSDFIFVTSTVRQQPVRYFVPQEEKGNKDRARFSGTYMDFVNQITITPEINQMYSRYYGRPIPSCWLVPSGSKDCASQTIKVRSAFMLAKNTGYVPKTYDDNKNAKFGFFRQIRHEYDRGMGLVDKHVKQYINNFRIWKKEDSCIQKNASLTHQNCEVRKIAYHLNEGFPQDLKPEARKVVDAWNVIFAKVVKSLSGKTDAKVFTFCPNNPVQKGDPVECGGAGTNPQIGDIRYSFIYGVNGPQAASPLGYGPSTSDPETGETLSANSYIYLASLDASANRTTEIVRLLTGELKADDITSAKKIRSYYTNLQGLLQKEKLKRFSHGHVHKFHKGVSSIKAKMKQLARDFRTKIDSGHASFDYASSRVKASMELPQMTGLTNHPEFTRLFNTQSLSSSMPQQSTPGLHQLMSKQLMDSAKLRFEKLSGHNIMMADFVDDSLLATALRLKEKHKKADGKLDLEGLLKSIRKGLFVSVTLHEMGHNVGLRHNYAGSADALNYHDHYWELRATTVQRGDTAPKPEPFYSSPKQIDDAVKKGLREYQNASIMEYSVNFVSNQNQLGKYDEAAIMYGYAGQVQVFKRNQTVLSRDEVKSELVANKWHYTQIPRLVSGAGKDFTQQIKSIHSNARTYVSEKEYKANSSYIQVPFKFCTDQESGGLNDCAPFDQGADSYERVRYYANRYWNYYIFNNFRRGRVNFGNNIQGYMSRLYQTSFSRIANQYKHFFNNWVNKIGTTCDGQNWYVSQKCGSVEFYAAVESLNFFGKVLQIPEVGCYEKTRVGSTYEYKHISSGSCPTDGTKLKENYIEVPLGVGRKLETTYNREQGGYLFFVKPENIGSWIDKYLAVLALSDPYTRFLGQDNSGAYNSYLVNYWQLFGLYVNNMIGGFVTGDYSKYAPTINRGTLEYRNTISLQPFNPNPVVPFAYNLNPKERGFSKILAGYVASMQLSSTYNQGFNESMKISVRGLSESPEVPKHVLGNPNQYVEITEPNTNRVYYAVKVNTASPLFQSGPKQLSVGYFYLLRLKNRFYESDGKTLRQDANKAELQGEFHYIKIMMGWLRASEYNQPR